MKVKLNTKTLQDIADAIRRKTHWDVGLRPPEMAVEIEKIPTENTDDRNAEWINRTLKTVRLPEGTTEIQDTLFYGCSELSTMYIPETVKSIGYRACYECKSLALPNLPDGIEVINQGSFFGCENITIKKLPNSLIKIYGNFNDGAFQGCKKLKIQEIPESVTIIDYNAFADCEGLTFIKFMGTPNSIHGSSFAHCQNLLLINVPWSEGEVAGAPWGATNATINYNYIYKEDANGDQDTIPL